MTNRSTPGRRPRTLAAMELAVALLWVIAAGSAAIVGIAVLAVWRLRPQPRRPPGWLALPPPDSPPAAASTQRMLTVKRERLRRLTRRPAGKGGIIKTDG